MNIVNGQMSLRCSDGESGMPIDVTKLKHFDEVSTAALPVQSPKGMQIGSGVFLPAELWR